jgi:hypothetical protein
MTTQIKITQLTDIGSANLAVNTLLPVVNMSGTPTTQKTTLGNLANVILSQSGSNYARVASANIAYSVANAAQPNITSVGTLTSLSVTGNVTSGNVTTAGLITVTGNIGGGNITTAGKVGAGTLSVTGTTNLGSVGNVTITGGTNGQVLTTNGSNVLSWTTVSGGGTTPGGVNTQIQFNDSGTFNGNTGFTFNKTTGLFTAPFLAGNGNGLANIQGANVLGTVGNANLSQYLNVSDVNNNFSYHIALSAGSGDKSLHIDADDNLQYNPADGTLTAVRVDAGFMLGNLIYSTGYLASNVVGLGNIATLNLTGSTSNVLYGNGVFAPVTSSGNTGNVTFDDVTVQGVNELNLSAGPDYTANLAYLQVRSGDVASHIHFDTGNSEAYDLIVGNDAKFVQVSSTGNIIMSSYDSSNAVSYAMTLDNTGNLILPGNTVAINFANGSSAFGNIVATNLDGNVSNLLTGNGTYVAIPVVPTVGNIATINLDGSNSNVLYGNGTFAAVSTSFDGEMHVSKDGNDSTGTGTILRPYLTITHALTQVTGGRNTVVIHPGTYTENPTITSQATQLITYDATGASTLVDGTVTIANVTGRIAGLKMTNLAITGNAQAYINSSTVDGQFTKSSSGYVEVDDCELQATGNVLISGPGITTIIGNKTANLVVNNAGASVLVKGADDCVMPQVTAGSLNIVDSIIRASSNTANAVTASAGTVVTLMNNQIVTPAADNVARVSIAGYHSIISLVYDKANSTLSNSLNSVAYFQTANVDSLVSSGNITGNYILGNGSGLTSLPAPTVAQDITSNGAMSIMTYDGNLKYVNYATVEPSTGNIAGGNISTTGAVTANTANITTGNITTINSGLLQNGNSNITITSNGNVSIQAAGSNVELVVTSTGANITGTLTSTGKIGYASGSTVTQTSNRGNGVNINALAGTIVTVSASMTAGEIGAFSVTNNQVDTNNDIVLVQVVSPNLGNYNVIANPNSGIGGFYLTLQNISGFPISAEAVTIRFMVIKAPNA